MPRSVTSPTLTKAGAGVSEPAYLLQVDWISLTSRMCTHSTVVWQGVDWLSGGFAVAFDKNGSPSTITIADPDATYRTLVLLSGLSERRVRLWKAYIGALGDDDPVALFDGFADGCDVAGGRVNFSLDYNVSARQFSPRERIGPNVGVNFIGAPDTKVYWAGQILTLNPGNR